MKTISRRLSLACVLLGALISPAGAASSDSLTDYSHTQWTAADGAPPGILNMAQTADGWLWLATSDGLYRFDGVQFHRYKFPHTASYDNDRIESLLATPDGDLYITHFIGGFSILHPDGSIDKVPVPTDYAIRATVRDRDGSLWAMSNGILHLEDGVWRPVYTEPELGIFNYGSLLLDPQGQLWAGNSHGAWRLDRKAGKFIKVGSNGGQLTLTPDGGVWQVRNINAIEQLSKGTAARPEFYPQQEAVSDGIFDNDGMLWALNCPAIVCRVKLAPGQAGQPASTERLLDITRLSGQSAYVALQDSEGNIWISTEAGLDRFRRNRLLRTGLQGSGLIYSLATDSAGTLWAANRSDGTLWRLKPDAAPKQEEHAPVSAIANGRDGAIFIGSGSAIERVGRDGVDVIPLPPDANNKPRQHNFAGMLDDGKVLWTVTAETGLIGWHSGKWWPRASFNLPPRITQTSAAGVGQLWLATQERTLAFYDNNKLRTYHIGELGLVASIHLAGEPLISGADGAGLMRGGKLLRMSAANPDVLRNVSGLVVTTNGDRWLNSAAGLVHVSAADWLRSIANPQLPLRYEVFGTLEGYPGRAIFETRLPSMLSPDGRNLWLLATGGVMRFDTAALPRAQAVPRPSILSVATDQQLYTVASHLRLPPGSEHFRIVYTAPLLRAPESARFEFRLDGVDRDWQDAGNRRATSYTKIGAGDYTFRVRVYNELGMLSEGEAVLQLTVAPTVVQTWWFKLLCALAAGLAGWLLYHYRKQYLARQLIERLEVRTAERERIAIELHDTVLQSMHGVIMFAENAAEKLVDQQDAKHKLTQAIQYANNAIIEGRDRVQSLRQGSDKELVDMFDELLEREPAPMAVNVQQTGVSRDVHMVVKDELYVVGREALRNAIRHSQAKQVTVLVSYGARELLLEVCDDGIGIPAEVLAAGGRPGHMGLGSMCGRAEQIGARCGVESRPGATVVRIAIAARLAYQEAPPQR